MGVFCVYMLPILSISPYFSLTLRLSFLSIQFLKHYKQFSSADSLNKTTSCANLK